MVTDAEWQILDKGQACTRFTQLAGTAIRGHNNEQFRDLTVAECEDACCSRDWCKSFDYLDLAGQVHCNLADVDATRQFGDVTQSATWDLYERPEASIEVATPALGNLGCAAMLTRIATDINDICCAGNGDQCSNSAPRTCSKYESSTGVSRMSADRLPCFYSRGMRDDLDAVRDPVLRVAARRQRRRLAADRRNRAL